MSLISGSSVTGAGGAVGGYEIERSLRFNAADSAYLNRTPASAGNRKTWTMSLWMKLGTNSGNQRVFGCHPSVDDLFGCFIATSGKLNFWGNAGGAASLRWESNAVFRDYSAWYHMVVQLDTTQATSTNRIKVWINNELQTTSSYTAPSQNADLFWNSANAHWIGKSQYSGDLNAYLTEIHFIDGQALTPTDFGEFNTDTGVWQPIEYTGTYGTNGFYLDFADNTSTTTLGYDAAGSNDWTLNNFSVTAGAGNDSLVDSPTRYGTDTGAGGEVRGNYCTYNPLAPPADATLSNGNLDIVYGTSATRSNGVGTIGMTSGKWYWEVTITSSNVSPCTASIGITQNSSAGGNAGYVGSDANAASWGYYGDNGNKYFNSVGTAYGDTFTTNDVIGVAFDADAGSLFFYKNGTVQDSGTAAFTSLTSGPYYPAIGDASGGNFFGAATNFGQRPFAHTAPSGFKALVTTNLPTPTIEDGGEYFNTVLYTGTGSSLGVTGVGFQPDLVWGKSRSNAISHVLGDVLRGNSRALFSNLTDAEDFSNGNYVASFDADGFTVNGTGLNTSSATYVAWNWKANGSGSSNTDGTITSTVSANTTSGISICTYTGTGANATVGHGLGVAPSMVIAKSRSNAFGWYVYHQNAAASPATGALILNGNNAFTVDSGAWNNTSPTSSVFSLGSGATLNTSSATYVAYCFAAIPGYSAFGSYTGNGSADGPFVYTGFRPAFVMVKRFDDVNSWNIWDNKRNPYNQQNNVLYANSSSAEDTRQSDFVSNGFKFRGTSTEFNASGGTYIYAAFAENPFSIALAR